MVSLSRVIDMYFRRLYNLRTDSDMTHQQVADFLVCNRQVYARYKRGLREVPVSMLIKLSKLYNTSVDYILDLNDNKTTSNKLIIIENQYKKHSALAECFL